MGEHSELGLMIISDLSTEMFIANLPIPLSLSNIATAVHVETCTLEASPLVDQAENEYCRNRWRSDGLLRRCQYFIPTCDVALPPHLPLRRYRLLRIRHRLRHWPGHLLILGAKRSLRSALGRQGFLSFILVNIVS